MINDMFNDRGRFSNNQFFLTCTTDSYHWRLSKRMDGFQFWRSQLLFGSLEYFDFVRDLEFFEELEYSIRLGFLKP